MKKVALVSGANRGIGFEICRQLSAQGIHVLLASRSLEKGETAAEVLKNEGLSVTAFHLDVENPEHISSLSPRVVEAAGQLDILVNNAGVLAEEQGRTIENFSKTIAVNLNAPFEVTETLMPLLKQSPSGRIVNHSSILGSLDTVGKPSMIGTEWLYPGYSASKAALNMLTVVWARQLEGTSVKVNSAHPGWVLTELGGPNAPMSLQEGAETAVWLATLPEDGPTGMFFHKQDKLAW